MSEPTNNKSRTLKHLALAAASTTVLFTVPARAQYTYVRIDTPGTLTSVYAGTVNNQGEVAFTGFHSGSSAGIYKGSGGPLTTIAATGSQFTFFNGPVINCKGEVAFRGIATTNGIWRGNGGPLVLIHAASNGVDGPGIDTDGTAVMLNNAVGIVTGSGGPTTVIAPYGGLFTGFGSVPDILGGTVAFQASLSTGESAIYTSTSGVLTQVAISGSVFTDTQLPRIGCNGSLVWVSNTSAGTQAIRTRIGGATTTFVDTLGPYEQFGYHNAYSINYYDEVAFSARLDGSGYIGIYRGPNPVTDKVIGPGDSLAGKIVRDALFGGLNDIGQVSFGVLFSDFTFGMFRADPAVPNSDPGCCKCPADFNIDGFVTGDDFDAFVAAFETGDTAADFNVDGFVTGDDFDAFVVAFEDGC